MEQEQNFGNTRASDPFVSIPASQEHVGLTVSLKLSE